MKIKKIVINQNDQIFDIYKQDKKLFSNFVQDFKKTIKKTNFINGDPVSKFETKFSKFCGTKFTVACNSGSDALFLALKSLNLKKDSEVILPAQTYCSTLFAVIRADLKPVLVDIQNTNPTILPNEVKRKITKKPL